jgi:short-subunit dehydrogenase
MNEHFAIVTGASKGIGYEIFNTLKAEGYEVIGLSRSQGSLPKENWFECDITDSESVHKAFEEAIRRFKTGIDVIVLNAGMGVAGALEFTSEENYKKQIDVNVFGTIACAKLGAQIMREQGYGKMIFISSLGAIFPLPFQSFYSAGKAAVNALSDSLGIELAPFGVETCTVMLNDVKTEFTANRIKNYEGDSIYEGRIEKSVSGMEKSEQNGMSPKTVAECVAKLLKRRKLPPHKIVGVSNEFLGLLYRILPTPTILWILKKMYG